MRHRVGQLDSVKNIPLEELESLRIETAERLKILEDQYWGKRDKQDTSHRIRDKYKHYGTTARTEASSTKEVEHQSPP